MVRTYSCYSQRMEITVKSLGKLVTHCGAAISIVDSKGETRTLSNGDPDIWDLAEKADKFFFEGRWHSRAEIEALMDERLH